MPYPDVYKRIETTHRKPMKAILKPLLNTHGIQKTAEILGVSDTTIERWADRAGVALCWTDADSADCAAPHERTEEATTP